jgi:ankyrin repeat protein
VKLICEKGVDVNPRDMWGTTALMTACNNQHVEMVKYLLFKGADPRKAGISGQSADFIKFRNREMYALLMKYV